MLNYEEIKELLKKALESNYEIVDISKEYQNRPPSKMKRIYIEIEEDR